MQINIHVDDRIVAFFRRLLRRRWVVAGLGVAVLASAGLLYASVPNAFAPGEVILSSKVNQNFAALDERVTALEARPQGFFKPQSLIAGTDVIGNEATTVSSITLDPGKYLAFVRGDYTLGPDGVAFCIFGWHTGDGIFQAQDVAELNTTSGGIRGSITLQIFVAPAPDAALPTIVVELQCQKNGAAFVGVAGASFTALKVGTLTEFSPDAF
jgi:hypothetical protein